MRWIVSFSLFLTLVPGANALAGEQAVAPENPKELSGMSIVGNDEAPKSLYIVPWKSSELGVKTSLEMLFDEELAPVDRDVFMRQLAFYATSRAQPSLQSNGEGRDGAPR
jgi:hypothetical protein